MAIRIRGPALLPIAICLFPLLLLAASKSCVGVPIFADVGMLPRGAACLTGASCSFLAVLFCNVVGVCGFRGGFVLYGFVFVLFESFVFQCFLLVRVLLFE